MSGSDEEDDYMGDLSLFLPPDAAPASTKIAISKPPSPSQPSKPKIPKTLPWQERRRLEKQWRQREEDEMTRAKLEEAIPDTNVGFKLLQRMGYKPGEGGSSEPVGIEIRRSRAGIGVGEEKKRRERDAQERKRKREEEMVAEFGSMRRSKWRNRRIVVDHRKAEAALAQLENREVFELEKEEDGENKELEEEEEEKQVTEEDLHDILTKLREEYHYCLYCGFKYESMEALLNDCPGLSQDDH